MAKLKPIITGFGEACDHILERMEGPVFLQTSWKGLNYLLMRGIAPNTILSDALVDERIVECWVEDWPKKT